MILSRYKVSGALCCSWGGGKPPTQASLLINKANYLLITILKDASVDMGEVEQHAAHLHNSSLPGLFLELFLCMSLMEPVETSLFITSPSALISVFALGSWAFADRYNERYSQGSIWDYNYLWYKTCLVKWRLGSNHVWKTQSRSECLSGGYNMYNAAGCFYLQYLLQ